MERISQGSGAIGRPDRKDDDDRSLVKEFADYAISFRRDADAEDAKPVHPH